MIRILFFFMIHNLLSAQGVDSSNVFQHPSGKNFTQCVSENLSLRYKDMQNFCLCRVGFVQFIVNKNRVIDSITLSKNIPSELAIRIKKSLLAIEGTWQTSSEKETKFLLPIELLIETGCKDGFDKDEALKSLDFLNFENGEASQTQNFIILKPSLFIHGQRGRKRVH